MSQSTQASSSDKGAKTPYNVGSFELQSNQGSLDIEVGDAEELDAGGEGELKQGLTSRHIQIFALAGIIGTGLFVGSGSALSASGPLGLLISYIVLSCVVYFIMNELAEMVTLFPNGGGAIHTLAKRYVDGSLSFATGWLYFYNYAILVPAEISAATIVIKYWTDSVNVAVWITIMTFVVIMLNTLAVKFYGETEFWLGSIKLIAIACLIIVGIVIFFGGGPAQHHVLGFHYWKHPGPLVNHLHLKNENTGRFLDIWTAIIKSGFAFGSGPEFFVITTLEAQDRRRNLIKGTRRYIWRLILIYCFSVIVIGVIVPSNNSKLTSGESNANASPFVIGIQLAGIRVLNHIINAAILTSAFSASNSFYFGASRVLYALAKDGNAPKFLLTTNRYGTPYFCTTFVGLISLIGYLNVSSGSSQVFTWLTNISTIASFIGWLIIGAIYLRFRKAMEYNDMWDVMPVRTIWQPYGAYVTTVFVALLTLTNGYAIFMKGNWSISSFMAAYVTIGYFLVFYIGHKVWTRNWRLFYKVEDIDVTTGLQEAEEEAREAELLYKSNPPRNIFERFSNWLF
ncbi:PUT4 [Cyberlindnera jadinii]|uniref:PUT4 protein n=1 Tax=Cyberlindnera jadinii (strain ATCC 18201 / CBS 1600 / BCRC 20928 / JCM 3617 / NBRC 0987 / NRRL Y-1542) TaxID=983966 RepID=A0A0H5BZ14_CYBJN|nr:PUT4 [Cyberlindnera jadinii]